MADEKELPKIDITKTCCNGFDKREQTNIIIKGETIQEAYKVFKEMKKDKYI